MVSFLCEWNFLPNSLLVQKVALLGKLATHYYFAFLHLLRLELLMEFACAIFNAWTTKFTPGLFLLT